MFVCLTPPLSPGEKTRTATFVFDTPCWIAVAEALGSAVVADWSESAGPSAPAVAVAIAAFVWTTSPSSPGLCTRTEMLRFEASSCVAVATAVALLYDGGRRRRRWLRSQARRVAGGSGAADGCAAVVMSAAVEADASAVTAFSCPTFGPLPGLSTRTAMWPFLAPTWSASAVAAAACPTVAVCSAAALPLPLPPGVSAPFPFPSPLVPFPPAMPLLPPALPLFSWESLPLPSAPPSDGWGVLVEGVDSTVLSAGAGSVVAPVVASEPVNSPGSLAGSPVVGGASSAGATGSLLEGSAESSSRRGRRRGRQRVVCGQCRPCERQP